VKLGLVVGLLPLLLLAGGSAAAQAPPAFSARVDRIDPGLKLVSWQTGCPVPRAQLRLLTLSHYGFDGRPHTGRLIVNADATRAVVTVFRRLYDARFPIRRLRLVDAYGASDFRSIEADNTSAFNCRYVDGTTRWSQHSYGRAIDVNPIENPYVTSAGTTSHAASRPYLDRSRHRPGMAYEGGALVRAFDAVGWGWGGRWSGAKDYQHFSASGR
jgi:hypothetical protein